MSESIYPVYIAQYYRETFKTHWKLFLMLGWHENHKYGPSHKLTTSVDQKLLKAIPKIHVQEFLVYNNPKNTRMIFY